MLVGGIIGINVFVVLLTGIVSGAIIMLAGGHITPVDLLTNMGSGVSGMFETCMVAILVAAMCALIREYGGFDALPELAAWLLDRYPMGIAVMLVLLLTGMCAGISYFRNRTDTEQRRII